MFVPYGIPGGSTLPWVVEPRRKHRRTHDVRPLSRAGLVLALVACTHPGVSAQPPPRGEQPTSEAPFECAVTLPDGSHRPRDPAGLGAQGFGNGEIWVGLWPHGVVRATSENLDRRGAIVMKFPWDRAVRGRLRISGRRLDAAAPPLHALMSDYGPIGFQPSSLVFPTEGCWEITGRVAGRSLTFVTRVTLRV